MNPADIGHAIRQARKAKGITQEQLAALMFVSRQTISSWENARTQPDYESLNRLNDILGMNLAEVFVPTVCSPQHDDACASHAASEPQDSPFVTAEETSAVAEEPPAVAEEPFEQSEVVQPQPVQTLQPPVRILWAAAALFLLLAALFAFHQVRKPEPSKAYTPAFFTQTQPKADGHAYVSLYVKDNRVNLPVGNKDPAWSYTLFLREDAGIGFQIGSLRMVYFLEDGQTQEILYTTADIADIKQTSHLNGYGLLMMALGYTPSDANPAHPTGVGILLSGQDDQGLALDFTHYIPFGAYP